MDAGCVVRRTHAGKKEGEGEAWWRLQCGQVEERTEQEGEECGAAGRGELMYTRY